jgi:hypothetical protein
MLPIAVLLGQVALIYRKALGLTGGVVSYPLDDTFIHMAIGRHLAFDGVYGVSAREFASASSSIGWPFLLAAAFRAFGPLPWLPLALNAGFGVLLLLCVDRATRKVLPKASVLARMLAGLAVVTLTPLPTLVVLGMEHTAHAATAVAFVGVASAWLASAGRARPWGVASWAAASTLFRYEGLFVVALVVALAFARGRRREALVVAASASAPVLAFGAWAMAHGAPFLPVPVLLKERPIDRAHVGDLLGLGLMDRLGTEGALLAVMLSCAGLAYFSVRRAGAWSAPSLALVLTLGMSLLHIELAGLGWFYRYESYLLATGLAFGVATLVDLLPSGRDLRGLFRTDTARALTCSLVIAFLVMPLRARAVKANADTPLACANVFEQQMQSARFLARHFPHDRVAVNDIGAVAWTGDESMVDLVGLASLDVAIAKGMRVNQPPSPAAIEWITGGVKVAIVYDEWFQLPARWLRVGSWHIDNNRSVAFPTVAIYATDAESYPEVIDALRKFSAELPSSVGQLGRYTERRDGEARFHAGDVAVLDVDPAFPPWLWRRPGTVSPVAGPFFIEDDGTILLPGIGKVLLRGATPDDARVRVERALRGSGPTVQAPVRDATVKSVARSEGRRHAVLVTGAVPRAIELQAKTLAAALAAAHARLGADAFVWREEPDGHFVRLSPSELIVDALEDGDIVVSR